ncbi:hypothetical protein EOD41_05010 [Mucilaginibacter limnophilus]|uniref:Uncharacterized protein n=1 Tax=Mucilaginibacter limnophilus TaxID=1932778 RepID=A0A3S2Y3U5_9SPHI|nr:hypothetical protein [Mucilaginibacter limnophilus]RVU01326.1 hypothetical protein EOD41_05010 [Mucilaginibacter limnophilus]
MTRETVNKLHFPHGNPVEFEYPIQEQLQIGDVIVVLLDIPPKVKYELNVFAFSTSGDFLWRVQETELFYRGSNCPYVGLTITDNQQLVQFNWCDTAIIMNPSTGEILDKYITK